MNKVGLYAGCFDPFTNGHFNIVERATKLFDKIHIVIGASSSKNPLFSIELRKEMISKIYEGNSQIIIDSCDGLIVDYAKRYDINFLIRGLRPTGDFESEFQMASMNKKLNQDIETYFLMTENDYYFISSSLVKEISNYNGDVSSFVPKVIQTYLTKIKNENK